MSGLARTLAPLAAAGCLLAPATGHASFLSGEMLDTAADWLAIFVIVLVPVVRHRRVLDGARAARALAAEQRHHPQAQEIQVLCLLSLVFGGLLWPLAWLWAYSKPVLYKIAYGTDKAEHPAADAAAQEGAGPHVVREDVP